MAYHQIRDPERLHALIEAILLIEADASLSTLLHRIVETAARLVGARYGALGVLASNGESLSRFITWGIDEEQRTLIGDSPHGAGVLGETIRLAAPLRIDELAQHPSSAGFPAHHPVMHRFLGVPVKTGNGRVYGNLYLTDPLDGEPFDQADQDVVEAFGHAAGIVIDQALLRSHMRELTLSEERERIARDLHDLLGHTLSVIVLKSELASRLSATQPERAAEEIRDVERISREALAQVRAAVRGYRSAGFESELHQAREALEAAGIAVEARVEQPQLSAMQESVFALALREAVTNIVRHAHATICRLSLRQNGRFCELEIADNGRGGALEEGSGLSGMRERVEALGGMLERDGSNGTLLRIRVPV